MGYAPSSWIVSCTSQPRANTQCGVQCRAGGGTHGRPALYVWAPPFPLSAVTEPRGRDSHACHPAGGPANDSHSDAGPQTVSEGQIQARRAAPVRQGGAVATCETRSPTESLWGRARWGADGGAGHSNSNSRITAARTRRVWQSMQKATAFQVTAVTSPCHAAEETVAALPLRQASRRRHSWMGSHSRETARGPR